MEGVVYWPPGNDETDGLLRRGGEGEGRRRVRVCVVVPQEEVVEEEGEEEEGSERLMKWRHYRYTQDTKPTILALDVHRLYYPRTHINRTELNELARHRASQFEVRSSAALAVVAHSTRPFLFSSLFSRALYEI